MKVIISPIKTPVSINPNLTEFSKKTRLSLTLSTPNIPKIRKRISFCPVAKSSSQSNSVPKAIQTFLKTSAIAVKIHKMKTLCL